jgi:hypothetical protein
VSQAIERLGRLPTAFAAMKPARHAGRCHWPPLRQSDSRGRHRAIVSQQAAPKRVGTRGVRKRSGAAEHRHNRHFHCQERPAQRQSVGRQPAISAPMQAGCGTASPTLEGANTRVQTQTLISTGPGTAKEPEKIPPRHRQRFLSEVGKRRQRRYRLPFLPRLSPSLPPPPRETQGATRRRPALHLDGYQCHAPHRCPQRDCQPPTRGAETPAPRLLTRPKPHPQLQSSQYRR